MRYDEFFRMAQGEYEPVKLSRLDRWRQKRFLRFVANELKDTVADACEDVWSTSCAKELRKYADGRTYVRFECRMLKPDCTFEDPLQILILLGARRELLGMATVYGTGNGRERRSGRNARSERGQSLRVRAGGRLGSHGEDAHDPCRTGASPRPDACEADDGCSA